MTEPRATRQRQRSAATRLRIVEATIATLVALGYGGATVREISRRAGVSQGGLFRHYPTRADVILAAVEHLHARQVAAVRALVVEHPALDEEWLSGLRDRARTTENLAWLEVMVAARTDADLRGRIVELMLRQEEELDAIAAGAPAFANLDPPARKVWVHIARRAVQGGAIIELGRDGPAELPRLDGLVALHRSLAATRDP